MSAEPLKPSTCLHPTTFWIGRLPFTLVFLALMLMANVWSGSLSHPLPAATLAKWGIGHDSLLSGEVFRLITGIFLSHDPGMALRQFLFAATAIGYTEWTCGTARSVMLFFALDLVATVILLAGIDAMTASADLTSKNDVGMSLGGFGLIGVAIAKGRARWLLGLVLVAVAVKFLLAPDILADAGHVVAVVLGFGLGILLVHPPGVFTRRPRSEH